jgi:hypothetical protein
MRHNNNLPMLAWLRETGINWRYPNEYGLCDRNLDCLQRACMEVLRWKGERNLIQIFLNPFDCKYTRLKLRRKEPQLQQGWGLIKQEIIDKSEVERLIRSVVLQEGYCLIRYNAYYMKFSSYYQLYDINHWSLVVGFDDEHIILADHTGSSAYFQGQIGRITWEDFNRDWEQNRNGIVAFLAHLGEAEEWDLSFLRLIKTSVMEMTELAGADRFSNFIRDMEELPVEEIRDNLDRLEFDMYYYRQLRELWKTAAVNKVVPPSLYKSGWVEELTSVCMCWSLIMGVVMKWKKQIDKNYRSKLVDYLHQLDETERSFFGQLERLTYK